MTTWAPESGALPVTVSATAAAGMGAWLSCETTCPPRTPGDGFPSCWPTRPDALEAHSIRIEYRIGTPPAESTSRNWRRKGLLADFRTLLHNSNVRPPVAVKDRTVPNPPSAWAAVGRNGARCTSHVCLPGPSEGCSVHLSSSFHLWRAL